MFTDPHKTDKCFLWPERTTLNVKPSCASVNTGLLRLFPLCEVAFFYCSHGLKDGIGMWHTWETGSCDVVVENDVTWAGLCLDAECQRSYVWGGWVDCWCVSRGTVCGLVCPQQRRECAAGFSVT